MKPELIVRDAWRNSYPDAAAGFLAVSQAANPPEHAALEQRKTALEDELRQRFAGADRASLRERAPLDAYHAYYKRFDKTYHVQLQLESIVFKGKSLPRVAALVECMFIAELKNLLLTAGHDTESLVFPLHLDVASGEERYTLYNGQEQTLKPGDMYISDAQGVISSVIYGPDQRTRIRPETTQAVFTVYAPPGIGESAVRLHLQDIASFVQVVSPQAVIEVMEAYS
jgi:DNA/RNA-binding domain of Phe-tRNA-synthetase-like protein